jgi:hypothetical protein
MLSLASMLAVFLAVAAPDAEADGPFCFSAAPFSDVFVWFVSGTGGNQFAGSGRDTTGNRAQTVAGFVSGTTAVVSFTTSPATSDFVPVIGGGTIDLGSGTGPGVCYAPDFEACGDFTFAAIACPPGATTDQATPDAGAGPLRVQGKVR